MSKVETPYTIEHVVAVDPHKPTRLADLRDVFLVVDVEGNEVARAYAPEPAALLAAALTLALREPFHGGAVLPGKPVRCPTCLGTESRVTDSRAESHGIMRRRECLACGARYKTVEQVTALTTPGKVAVPRG